MSDEKKTAEQTAEAAQEQPQQAAAPQPEEAPAKEKCAAHKEKDKTSKEAAKLAETEQKLAQEHDNYLRLCAEYDNFRKRSQREKDGIYADARASTVEKFLPVYDNLERALSQQTADEAFKKGVEMTMNQLVNVLDGLGVTIFGAAGETFDPAIHNAVMHCEDEALGENVIAEVFQKGFKLGDKIVRFAMVRVAN